MADSTEKTIAWSRSTFCNGADACVEVAFCKASASAAAGDCVEVGVCRCDGRDLVLVRDSKDPDGPTLIFTPAEWAAFTAGVRDGEFDLLALSAADGSDGDGGSRGCGAPVAGEGPVSGVPGTP